MWQRFLSFLDRFALSSSSCTCTQNQVVEQQPNDFQGKTVLYNFLVEKEAYKRKCTHIIQDMNCYNWLRDFSTLNKDQMDYFKLSRCLNDNAFTDCDFQHVLYFRPLLRSILNTGYEYIYIA